MGVSGLKAQRVGLFGGAFDPPHRAHASLAQAAIEQLNLDVLHIVPTGHAWHKQRALTEARHRLAMCHLAFANIYRALVDDREIMRSGPTYTIDTLKELQAMYPQAQLFLIMGADQARALQSWHRVEELEGAAIICVASRSDSNASTSLGYSVAALPGAVFQPVQMPPSPLSATEIRDRSARGQSVAPLVFESVARYIDQHHLYQSA